jgi:uncharacterized membrane protein (UPF0127 family)
MDFQWSLEDRLTGRIVVQRLAIAATWWSRFWGLQFRAPIAPDCGLLLVPCSGIHTCWLRFSLDLAFVDHSGTILGIRRNVRPWRIATAPSKTHAVLEMRAGALNLHVGDSIRLIPQFPGQPFPSQLHDFAIDLH